jgi:hypothetical protein
MTQNRYGVLLSLLLLGLLTAGFFVAAKTAVDKLDSSVASANATATATPMTLNATTSVPSGSPRATATATPSLSDVSPTATPLPQSGNVVINNSGGDTTHSMTSLPSSTSQVWCHIVAPGVAAGTAIKFRFQRIGTPGDYWVQPESVASSGNGSYILGPLQTGQWRCLVEITSSAKLVGSTSFTITTQ